MAVTELKKFSPQLTQGLLGGSRILDENLLKIKAALDDANATIIRQQLQINTLITSTTINISVPPAAPTFPPGFGADEDVGGETLVPGPPGLRGLTGPPGMPGLDADADMDAGPAPAAASTLMARIWLSTPDPSVPNGVNMGALGTGLLRQSVTAGVATPAIVTMPLADRVMISTGQTTDPIGNAALQWDNVNQVLYVGAPAKQKWANVGTLGTANTEYIEASWASNIFSLEAKQTGGLTVRAIKVVSTAGVTIDDHLEVNGANPSTNDSMTVAAVTNNNRDHVKFFVGGGASQDTPGNNSLFVVTPSNTTVPAGVAGGTWSTVRIDALTYTGVSSPFVTEATTLFVAGAPTLSGLTGGKYAVHVNAGETRLDGQLTVQNSATIFAVNTNTIGLTPIATIASGAAVAFGGVAISPSVTITGATNITTAAGFNAIDVSTPLYGGSMTITHAAALAIAGAPSISGGGAITNPYSIWVQGGLVRIDGVVNLGGGAAPTFGTIGGTGPTAAAQSKWLPINSGGTKYWIPVWA